MVSHPRTNSYVRTDGWEAEAAKWRARKGSAEAAE
jgi:sulfite reductase alpha subunit